MADLRTDYKDDLLDTSVNERRKYNMITNEDGTVSFEDVTVYSQVGDTFGAGILNEIILKLPGGILNTMEEVEANTQENQLVGALAMKELIARINELEANLPTLAVSGTTLNITIP